MDKLFLRKPILHALMWLSLVIVLSSITKALSLFFNVDYYNLVCIPFFFLLICFLLFIKKNNLYSFLNLRLRNERKLIKMLFYFPLLILIISPLSYGIKQALSGSYYVISFTVIICISIILVVIFQGFLFSSMKNKGNHVIVFLFLAFGYALVSTLCLVKVNVDFSILTLYFVNYLILGFMFLMIMVSSSNLIVCIVTQTLYSFLLSICNIESLGMLIMMTGSITLLYFAYLVLKLKDVLIYFAYPRKK